MQLPNECTRFSSSHNIIDIYLFYIRFVFSLWSYLYWLTIKPCLYMFSNIELSKFILQFSSIRALERLQQVYAMLLTAIFSLIVGTVM